MTQHHELPNEMLVQQAQNGDLRARATLVERNRGLVQKVAQKYHPERLSFEDLVQEGMIGFLKAIDRFDPERGCQFSTFAVEWVRQAIGRAIANQDLEIRLPVHVQQDPEKRRRAPRVIYSLDELVGQDEDTPILHLLEDQDALDPGEEAERQDERAALRGLLATLKARERQVIELRFGFAGDGPRTLAEVSAMVGMTREGVRQAEKRALQKLRALAEGS